MSQPKAGGNRGRSATSGLPAVRFVGSSQLITPGKRRTRNDSFASDDSFEKINALAKKSPLAKMAQLGKMCANREMSTTEIPGGSRFVPQFPVSFATVGCATGRQTLDQ
ncbi:MAG: hypothetical protein VXZ38_00125 [Planctomycetota bacterium]|nr:hypothetical protein [Planctomycetota bacterium]